MNNAFLTVESLSLPEEDRKDYTERLQMREGQLVRILEALKGVEASESWSTLKKEVFDGAIEGLERRLAVESKKRPLDEPAIYELQGQILSAKKYDLSHLVDITRLELANVRKQLQQ